MASVVEELEKTREDFAAYRSKTKRKRANFKESLSSMADTIDSMEDTMDSMEKSIEEMRKNINFGEVHKGANLDEGVLKFLKERGWWKK